MTTRTSGCRRWFALVALTAALAVGPASRAMADEQIIGTITSRLTTGFIMHMQDGTVVTVSLRENTALKVDDGLGTWEASDLVPGLRVKVEGAWISEVLVAREIKFSAEDLRTAAAIKAGLTLTNEQVQRNTADIERHGSTLGQHGRDLANHEERIVATTGAIATTNERIGRLDDYNVVDSFTVHFANGQARVPAKYLPQLEAFAGKAKGVEGFMLQVEGFASAVGRAERNDELSHLRAEAVTAVLQQRGGIPSANFFLPAALGTTQQVAPNKTAKGQAQNRRVVVTILQNKGIAQAY
jgi:outer membrane protein OmpA-like peptidoglycan-associated protein